MADNLHFDLNQIPSVIDNSCKWLSSLFRSSICVRNEMDNAINVIIEKHLPTDDGHLNEILPKTLSKPWTRAAGKYEVK